VLLTRRMEFSASHRLEPEGTGFSHGHNYELEVTLQGHVDAETGMVIDLKELKDLMDREVGVRFDHRDLNDDTSWFSDQLPTAENFAQVIFQLLDGELPERLLARVRLSPTPDYTVEVAR